MNDFPKNAIPILIGSDAADIDRLRRQFGYPIHVFDTHCGLSARFSPLVKFHRVSKLTDDILTMYIRDIANKMPDSIPLVTASGAYSQFLESITSAIECHCIVIQKESMP